MPPKRSFGVTLLLLMVLILIAWGLTRFVAAWRAWDILQEFNASLGPLYLSITGAGWGVAGVVLFSGIWRRKRWSYFAAVALTIIWLIEYWLERILSEPPRANLPFALFCSFTVIFYLWIVTMIPGTKSFFIKSEEHEQPIENPNPE